MCLFNNTGLKLMSPMQNLLLPWQTIKTPIFWCTVKIEKMSAAMLQGKWAENGLKFFHRCLLQSSIQCLKNVLQLKKPHRFLAGHL